MSSVNGDITWAKSISGTLWDINQDIFIDNSDNILLTGYHQGTTDFDPGPATFNLSADGLANAFVLKLNSSGDFVWAKTIGGSGIASNTGDGIAADNVGNVYVSIAFQNTTDFDPGAGTFNIVSKGQSDMGVLKLDAAGNFIWAYSTGSTGSDGASSIAVDNLNKLYVTGIFALTPDFDPGACIFNMTSGGFIDTFLQKMSMGPPVLIPTFSSFAPASGPIGTPVTLTGANFSTTPANNAVTFNATAAIVTASTTTSISTTVPAGATTGKISVTVNCFTVQSATNFIVGASALPTITSFTPALGAIGATVTITGTNFSTTPANNTVNFNGTTATVTASTTTSITTTVPPGTTTGKITVTVSGNTATSATDFTVTTAVFPTITSFTPVSGVAGTSVTIFGTNFSTTPASNLVKLNGTTATVTTSSATSITTTVPAGASTGKITVTVGGNTATSATDFTVTSSTGIIINPQPQSTATCTGATATFTLTASGAANLTYQWQKFNGSTFSNISNGSGYTGVTTATLSINTTGNFGAGDYRCKVSGDGTSDAFSSTVALTLGTSFTPTITANGSQLQSSPGDSYQWYKNGILIPQATSQFLEYNTIEYGTYYVVVTATECTSSSGEFIYLITAAEQNKAGLKIYPNPFSDRIFIELPTGEKCEVVLLDATGRLAKRYIIHGNTSLQLHKLVNGCYNLIVKTPLRNQYFRMVKSE